MNKERDWKQREAGDEPYTVVGEYVAAPKRTFVDWVWDKSVADAALQVTTKRRLGPEAVLAIFSGHKTDLLV